MSLAKAISKAIKTGTGPSKGVILGRSIDKVAKRAKPKTAGSPANTAPVAKDTGLANNGRLGIAITRGTPPRRPTAVKPRKNVGLNRR